MEKKINNTDDCTMMQMLIMVVWLASIFYDIIFKLGSIVKGMANGATKGNSLYIAFNIGLIIAFIVFKCYEALVAINAETYKPGIGTTLFKIAAIAMQIVILALFLASGAKYFTDLFPLVFTFTKLEVFILIKLFYTFKMEIKEKQQ